jgi:hypothetical protein
MFYDRSASQASRRLAFIPFAQSSVVLLPYLEWLGIVVLCDTSKRSVWCLEVDTAVILDILNWLTYIVVEAVQLLIFLWVYWHLVV